jgi:hypothetical protein
MRVEAVFAVRGRSEDSDIMSHAPEVKVEAADMLAHTAGAGEIIR